MFAVMPHVRLHQVAVLVGLPQERRRVMPHGLIGMRTDCLQPVIVRWRHTRHEVSIRLAVAAVNADGVSESLPDIWRRGAPGFVNVP